MKTSIKILSCVAAALCGAANVETARAGEIDAEVVCDHVCAPGGYGGYGGYDRYDAYDDTDYQPFHLRGLQTSRQFPRTQYERQILEQARFEALRTQQVPAQVDPRGVAPQQGIVGRQAAPQQNFAQQQPAPQQNFAQQQPAPQQGFAPQQAAPRQAAPRQAAPQQFAPNNAAPQQRFPEPPNGNPANGNVPNGNPPNGGNPQVAPGANDGRPSPLDALRGNPQSVIPPVGDPGAGTPPANAQPGFAPPQQSAPPQQGAGLVPTAFGALGGYAGA